MYLVIPEDIYEDFFTRHLARMSVTQMQLNLIVFNPAREAIVIKEDKIWIQRDGTEVGIANELIEVGVPKSDVLVYSSPYMRKFTLVGGGLGDRPNPTPVFDQPYN